jgi:alkylated DNA repair protein alkB family protein 8
MLSQSLRPLKETSMSVEQLTQELGQLNIVDYLPDDMPSQFLRCTMSRHVKDQLIEESKVRSFFMQLLNIENEEIIKRIAYGKGAKRTLLLECSSSEVAIQIKEKCDKKPSDLLKGKTIYMDFALHHKQKEERDNFLRIENVSSNHLAQDPMQRIPGLIILKEFITKEEEAHLLQQLDQDSKAKWQNDVKARQVQHFGYRFSYVTQ